MLSSSLKGRKITSRKAAMLSSSQIEKTSQIPPHDISTQGPSSSGMTDGLLPHVVTSPYLFTFQSHALLQLPLNSTKARMEGTTRHMPYSLFTKSQKRWIVLLAAFAGWFSTLSSFIYYPAIPALSGDLHTPIQKINLTVTSYLIVSAFVPSVMGRAADTLGRRPTFIVALSMYSASNIGCAVQSSFPALFVLRMVQAAGVSGWFLVTPVRGELTRSVPQGTFSIAYGVIADIADTSERGSYVGYISFGQVSGSTSH